MNRYYFYLTACLILCLLNGCRQELPTIRSEVEYVTAFGPAVYRGILSRQ